MGFNKQNITLHGLLVHDDARFSVGFLCRCCMKFPGGKVFFDKRQEIKFSFPSKLWLNSFKIVAISLPSHCHHTTHFRTEVKLLILQETKLKLFTQKSHFGFAVKTMPIENLQEFTSAGAWNISFCAQFAYGLTGGQSGRTRGLQIERSFSVMQDFWQSSEAVGLSQVSKMLQQLTGQILAHYSSSKIRNTHLRLFRLDQWLHKLTFPRKNTSLCYGTD